MRSGCRSPNVPATTVARRWRWRYVGVGARGALCVGAGSMPIRTWSCFGAEHTHRQSSSLNTVASEVNLTKPSPYAGELCVCWVCVVHRAMMNDDDDGRFCVFSIWRVGNCQQNEARRKLTIVVCSVQHICRVWSISAHHPTHLCSLVDINVPLCYLKIQLKYRELEIYLRMLFCISGPCRTVRSLRISQIDYCLSIKANTLRNVRAVWNVYKIVMDRCFQRFLWLKFVFNDYCLLTHVSELNTNMHVYSQLDTFTCACVLFCILYSPKCKTFVPWLFWSTWIKDQDGKLKHPNFCILRFNACTQYCTNVGPVERTSSGVI